MLLTNNIMARGSAPGRMKKRNRHDGGKKSAVVMSNWITRVQEITDRKSSRLRIIFLLTRSPPHEFNHRRGRALRQKEVRNDEGKKGRCSRCVGGLLSEV